MTTRTWLVAALSLGAFVAGPLAPGQSTTRVSIGTSGSEGNADAFHAILSADGRFVAFRSAASNLVPRDRNFCIDVFVHDGESGETTRASVSSTGLEANAPTYGIGMTPDGRYVAFCTQANNLVPLDVDTYFDVFIHDRETAETTRVEAPAEIRVFEDQQVALSADARFLAFQSRSPFFVPEDSNELYDVFRLDRSNGEIQRVSVDSSGNESFGPSGAGCASITADGRFVAFESDAEDLVAGDDNDQLDVFVHDVVSGRTGRASRPFDGLATGGGGRNPRISAGGRFVAFESTASDLVPGDTNAASDVFVRDLVTRVTERVSVDSLGRQSDAGGRLGSRLDTITPDGRIIVFTSRATNLVSDDTNTRDDVFVHDRASGETARMSLSALGEEASLDSVHGGVSANGRYVSFVTGSALVPGDTNHVLDVFVRDRMPCGNGTVNRANGRAVDVLAVNGFSGGPGQRVLRVPSAGKITLSLSVSPSGPALARYVLWVWAAPPMRQAALIYAGAPLGCLVDPSPFDSMLGPRPIRCFASATLPVPACEPGSMRIGPPSAPFTRDGRAPQRPGIFTLQGGIEDAGARHAAGFSVTNAVILIVQ